MVVGVHAHFFQVIVLATYTQAFLGVRDTLVSSRAIAEEQVLELVHARIGEHERGIILHHHGGAWDNGMTVLLEVVEEGLADLLGREHMVRKVSRRT